jgi:transposase-like protein
MRPAGGNHRTLKVLADRLAISTDQFDPHAAQREALLAEIGASSWCAVGRKYGVSDNAVRKWVRQYERERERGPPAAPPGQPELLGGAAAATTPRPAMNAPM